MNFQMFCEFEGVERNFAHVGSAVIGSLEFTVLECCTCHEQISLPGTLKVDLYGPMVTQQVRG